MGYDYKKIIPAAFLVLLLVGTGCEEDVTSVLGTEHAFSFYGVLSPQADTQKVVVYPVADRLTPLQPESLKADVRLTDRTLGKSYAMEYVPFQEPGGRWAHAFVWPASLQYDHTYRIAAENGRGEVTSVEVTMPPRAELKLQPPKIQGLVEIPAEIAAKVPRLMHIEVAYRVQFRPGLVSETVDTLFIDYDKKQKRTGSGWMIPIELTKDYQRLFRWCMSNGCWPYRERWGLLLLEMRLRVSLVNEAWDPPGSEHDPGVHTQEGVMSSFDPEVLVQPGTLSNVEGGFGFVGAGYILEKSWRPDDAVIKRAGFRASQ